MDGRTWTHQPQNHRWKTLWKRRSRRRLFNFQYYARFQSFTGTKDTSAKMCYAHRRRLRKRKCAHGPLPLKTKIKNRKSFSLFLSRFWLSRLRTLMANQFSQRKHALQFKDQNRRSDTLQLKLLRSCTQLLQNPENSYQSTVKLHNRTNKQTIFCWHPTPTLSINGRNSWIVWIIHL